MSNLLNNVASAMVHADAAGSADEREAIVRYLRELAAHEHAAFEAGIANCEHTLLGALADAIEAGAHRDGKRHTVERLLWG